MAFNKAKEEHKWRIWKEEEEREMRRLGVSEDIIKRLRIYDWEVFNSNRRFYQNECRRDTYMEQIEDYIQYEEFNTVDDLLNELENQQLYQFLIKVDKRTLQAVLLRMQGFSTSEIAGLLSMKEYALYKRLNRLKKKIKNILK